jgi:hypothetical protein
MCNVILNPSGCAADWLGDEVSEAVGQSFADMMEELARMTAEASMTVLGMAMSWWIQPPTLAVSDCGDLTDGMASDTCATPTGAVASLTDSTYWLVGLIAAIAIVIAVIKTAWRPDGQAAGETLKGIATLVVVAGMGVAFVQLLIIAGDAYSRWIMDQAMSSDEVETLLADMYEMLWTVNVSTMIITVLSFIALGLGFLQWLLLMARTAALVLMVGLLPVAGAAGVAPGGRAMRDKYFAWLAAFLLYKPVAATIYATAIWLIQAGTFQNADGEVDVVAAVTGFAVICMMFMLALAALPALMRLIAPAVSAVGGGSVAAGLGAAAGAASSVGTGAMLVTGRSGGSGSAASDGGGASGASNTGASTPAPGAGQDPAKAAADAGGKGGGALDSAGSAAAGGASMGGTVAAEAVQEGIDRTKAAIAATGAHAAGDMPTAQPGGPQGASSDQ